MNRICKIGEMSIVIDLDKLLNERVMEYNYLCQDAGNINDCYDKPFIIFGASTAGKEFFKYVSKFKKVFPIAFCDNDPQKQNTFIQGIPVLSVHKLMDEFTDDINIIIPSFSADIIYSIEMQMENAGINPFCFWNFFRLWSTDTDLFYFVKEIIKNEQLDCPNKILSLFLPKAEKNIATFIFRKQGKSNIWWDKELVEIQRVYGFLHDEKSREIYSKYVYAMYNRFITPFDAYYILKNIVDKNNEQYFALDIISFSDHETFIDAGAFDGETTLSFIKHIAGKYNKALLFEPDPVLFKDIQQKSTLKDKKIYIINKALYDVDGEVSFYSTGSSNGKVISCENDDLKVETASLDQCVQAFSIDNVSFIKMDIEGSEMAALSGARNTIKTQKPKMAICIYHKPEDIFTIPLLLKNLVPEYKLYIRSYFLFTELVCYAIYDGE